MSTKALFNTFLGGAKVPVGPVLEFARTYGSASGDQAS